LFPLFNKDTIPPAAGQRKLNIVEKLDPEKATSRKL